MTSRTLSYLFAALGLGLLFLVCCSQADARSPLGGARRARPPYTFSLEDEDGNSLATFVKDGRTFALGEPGQRYNIRIHNPTGLRVEAVVSVDGRDAVSGEPGDYVNQRGYVIPAYGSLLVEGFRRSLEEVASFRFTDPEDSYSARMGTPQNVGVIGVAFFAERVRPPEPVARHPRPAPPPASTWPDDYATEGRARESEREAPAARPARPRAQAKPWQETPKSSRNNLGTEFGESRESIVSSVSFERASATRPTLLSTLRYDDADGLRARGIELSGYRDGSRAPDEPQAFPISRFAQPPP